MYIKTMFDEILFMQTRLLRLAHEKWQKTNAECARIFEKYNVYEYIRKLYDLFHVQGDDANFEEIESYLKSKGAIL